MQKHKTIASKPHYKISNNGSVIFSLAFKRKLWNDYQNKCAYCGCFIDNHKSMNVDHVLPISKNGSHDIENLLPSCSSCNFIKGGRDLSFLRIAIPLRSSKLKGVISASQAEKLLELGIDIGITPINFFFEEMMVGGEK